MTYNYDDLEKFNKANPDYTIVVQEHRSVANANQRATPITLEHEWDTKNGEAECEQFIQAWLDTQ